ncbi:chromosome partition protein MukE [Pseudomonas aeruginosa]|nr:chromosome partition protein MukE [Pseudomonas aeruginosa]
MSDAVFDSLEEVIVDERFPEVDLMLRRGRHIGRDDGCPYDYLVEAQALLEPFYRRFGCELIQQSDGYFYLLPSGERAGATSAIRRRNAYRAGAGADVSRSRDFAAWRHGDT